MAKLPTIDEFARRVAIKALDEYEYEGKTVRQWVALILNGQSESLRPKGRWVLKECGQEDFEMYWVCSKCGDMTYFETNYCPNCGAKMEG